MSPSPEESGLPPRSLHDRVADELGVMALGGPADPEVLAHLADCPACRADLDAYRTVVRLGRGGDPGVGRETVAVGIDRSTIAPPARVWSRIAAEVGHDGQDMTPVAPSATVRTLNAVRPDPSRRRVPIRLAAAVLAVVLIVGAGVVGWAIGRQHTTPPDRTGVVAGRAALAAQPGTGATAHGLATMVTSSGGNRMQVSTSGLPVPDGYYEVWLFDPSSKVMVAVGTLGTDATGTFSLPAGIDTRRFHVVDVSHQLYNGDPRHRTSVLQGPITPA